MNEIIKTLHQQAQGFVQCFVVDAATGEVVREYPRQKNLILNQGMDQVQTNYWCQMMTYCSGGTGTTPTSDDSGLTQATQAGTSVTLAGGTFTFTNTATDAGNVIKWDTGEEAMISSVTNPTTVVVSNTATVAAGEFTVYRTNQSGLTTQVKRTSTYLTGSPYCGTTLTSNVYKLRRTYDFTAEVGTVNYTEVGLGWHTSTPTAIFSRILLAVPVTVTSGQQLRVTYELQITLQPDAPVAKTAIINGWPIAPATGTTGQEAIQLLGLRSISTLGSENYYDTGLDANEPSIGGGVGIFLATNSSAPASFGSTVDRHTGGNYTGATKAAYIAGTYYVDKTATFAVGNGNGTAWRSMGYGAHSPNVYFADQRTTIVFVFDEAQTKLNTHTLTLTWRFSWSRVLS